MKIVKKWDKMKLLMQNIQIMYGLNLSWKRSKKILPLMTKFMIKLISKIITDVTLKTP